MQTFEYLRERRPSRRSAYGITSMPTGVRTRLFDIRVDFSKMYFGYDVTLGSNPA